MSLIRQQCLKIWTKGPAFKSHFWLFSKQHSLWSQWTHIPHGPGALQMPLGKESIPQSPLTRDFFGLSSPHHSFLPPGPWCAFGLVWPCAHGLQAWPKCPKLQGHRIKHSFLGSRPSGCSLSAGSVRAWAAESSL